jgi:uncharacterized protein (TIGR02265 family)
MTTPKLVLSNCVEGLFRRGVGAQLTPRCRERLKAAGLDLDGRLEAGYPLERWRAWLDIAAAELYPQLSAEQAHFQLGDRFLTGYFETLFGRVVLPLLRALGPRRALGRLQQNFRSGNTFSEVVLVDHAEGDVEVRINDVFATHPQFVMAIITRAHQAAGAQDTQLQIQSFDGTACTLRLRWSEASFRRAG